MSHQPSRELDQKKALSHIAIIMDGNGRWTRQRGLPRTEGHRVGAERLKQIVLKCLDIGVNYLTVYAFSKENWKRPAPEVSGIMRLSEFFYNREFDQLKKKGVFFVHLGERNGLPRGILRILDNMEKNNARERKLHLNIAFNYSGRAELARAIRNMGEHLAEGKMKPSDITEKVIGNYLYTSGVPDPDLLIRTGGEMRLSNFLLWQIAYTELWVTEVLWPDFSQEMLLEAINSYRTRERRFGGI